MKKKLVRLTESDLHRIVKESVNRILKESDYVSSGYADKDGEICRNPKNGHIKRVKIGSKYENKPNKVGDYVSSGYADKDGRIFRNSKNGHTKRMNESHVTSYEEPVFIGCSSPNDADVSIEIGYSDYSSSLFYVGKCGTDGYAALAAVVEYLIENGIIDHYAYSKEDLEAYSIEDFIEVEGYYLPSWQIHMHQLIDNHGGRR